MSNPFYYNCVCCTLSNALTLLGSFAPRLSFLVGKESLVHTVCACARISWKNCQVTTSDQVACNIYSCVRRKYRDKKTCVDMKLTIGFQRLRHLYETEKLVNNHLVPQKGYSIYIHLPNCQQLGLVLVSQSFGLLMSLTKTEVVGTECFRDGRHQ